jgi:hypothetical protein
VKVGGVRAIVLTRSKLAAGVVSGWPVVDSQFRNLNSRSYCAWIVNRKGT